MESSPQTACRVSVIVPTLDEAENIDTLVEAVLAATSALEAEIVIVDDGSKDGTRLRAMAWTEATRSRGTVRLLARDGERGLSTAVLAAAKIARGDVVVVMDADLSHPPARIPDLVRPILDGACDMTVGSRYVPGGTTPGWPGWRRFLSRTAALLAWPVADVYDPTSGFFAVRRERLLGAGARAGGFKIGLEILARSGDALRVMEVPIEFRDRMRGSSKMGWNVATSYLRGLLSLGGGCISFGTAARFGIVGLLGMLLDLLCFQILYSAGYGLASAHMTSFVSATVFNYTFNARWSFRESPRRGGGRGISRYFRFFIVGLMALLLRGGVLALLVQTAGIPPVWGIAGAVGAAAAVNYIGAAFYVFPAEDAPPPELRWRIAALGIILFLGALRLVYLGLPDLLVEEAYYWNYAQHLDLSYLDHPPMVAWMIRLGTWLFRDTEFGVRIGAFLCWIIAAVFVYRMTANLFGKSTAFRATLLLAALPLFFGFGFFMTPDAPLLACWAGALHFLERATLGERRLAWWGAGVCAGLGMLSKYTILLLAPAALLFLCLDPASRRWFSRPEPYAAVLAALLIFAPVVVWNADHQWASFAFQSVDRIRRPSAFSLHVLAGWLMIILTPVGVAGSAKMFRPPWNRRGRSDGTREEERRRRFLLIFALVPLAVFAAFSFIHRPKLNWTAPACLPFLAWLAREMLPSPAMSPSHRSAGSMLPWKGTFLAAILVYGAALHYLVIGLPLVGYPDGLRVVGWHNLGAQVERIEDDLERATGREPLVVGMDKYNIASELAFYRTHAEREEGGSSNREGVESTSGIHLFGGNGLMYEYWFPMDRQEGRNIIMVGRSAADLEGPAVERRFDRIEPVRKLLVIHNRIPVGRFFYRIGLGYHALRNDLR